MKIYDTLTKNKHEITAKKRKYIVCTFCKQKMYADKFWCKCWCWKYLYQIIEYIKKSNGVVSYLEECIEEEDK